MLYPSTFRPKNMPPRLPSGLPANFKGITENKEQMAEVISKLRGGVPLDPLPVGGNALSFSNLPKKVLAGLKGFLGLNSFEPPEPVNKFTLRGAVNFTGTYPADLVAARKKAAL